MELIERIKKAYDKTKKIPDQLDCHQPLRVLYEAEKNQAPNSVELGAWMQSLFVNNDEMTGFLVGYSCNIPFTPSNARHFSEGFYNGKKLAKQLKLI
jgi:hypothetical protein